MRDFLLGGSVASKALRRGAVVFLGLLAGYLIMEFLGLVPRFGHYIPSLTLSGDYIIGMLWAFGLGVAIFFLPVPYQDKNFLFILWVGRALMTLFLMLPYESHYDLDSYIFYEDSRDFIYPPSFFVNGTFVVVWLMKQMREFLPIYDSYHALKVIWSFMGMAGVYFYFLGFRKIIPDLSRVWLLFIGFFPSLMFWSSNLTKDAPTFFGIGLYAYGAMSILTQPKLSSYVATLLGVAIAASIRVWLGGVLLVPLVIVLMFKRDSNPLLKWISMAVVLGVMVTNMSTVFQQFEIQSSQDFVSRADRISKLWGDGGSAQEAPPMTSVADVVSFIPKGVFTALFRPLPGEVMNMFGLAAGLENALLILFFIWGIRKASKDTLKKPEFLYIALIVFFWGAMYGFASYQNLGTASRFRLQILPFLLFIPIYFYEMERKANLDFSLQEKET